MRKTDGSPAVRLDDGHAMALSPDGKWALAHLRYTKPRQIVSLPTGAGESKTLVSDVTDFIEIAKWFPDSKHILLRSREQGYVKDIESGELRPILQESLIVRLKTRAG